MRRRILAFGWMAGLAGLLLAGGARAQTWEIIDGRVKGSDRRLTGFLTSYLGDPHQPSQYLFVGDFQIDAGKRSYTPVKPLSYRGLEPPFDFLNGYIFFDGDRIDDFSLRSGGDVVRGGGLDTVAFRIRDFHAEEGEVLSRDRDTQLPRRMRVSGRLYENTEFWGLPSGCPPLTPPPVSSPPPGSAGGVIIGTQIQRVAALQPILVAGADALSAGASLRLTAVGLPYNSTYNGHPLSIVGIDDDECDSLRFLGVHRRARDKFWLVASTALPMKIDVLPGSKRNRILPGTPLQVMVALLGSRELDVNSVDPDSLLLGRGEAEALTLEGGVRIQYGRVNGDRYADLIAFFEVVDAEVAFGDAELCLFAKTVEGEPLEGCDAVDTRPPSQR